MASSFEKSHCFILPHVSFTPVSPKVKEKKKKLPEQNKRNKKRLV